MNVILLIACLFFLACAEEEQHKTVPYYIYAMSADSCLLPVSTKCDDVMVFISDSIPSIFEYERTDTTNIYYYERCYISNE